MASRHAPVAPIGQYQPLHVFSTGTVVPVGNAVDTTATTPIAGGGAATTVTPASMAGIFQSKRLLVIGGLGTSEIVSVSSVSPPGNPTTFTATFQNAHPTQAAPAAPSATGNTGTGSAFTAAQTVNVAVSYVTAAGETTVSPNTLVTITTNGNNVVVPLPSFPAGVTGMNVYVSTSSGSLTLFRVSAGTTSTTSGGTVTVTGFAPNTNPAPPASNTSGQYHLISLTGTSLGAVLINTVGTSDQITLYNGSPNANAYSSKIGNAIAVIKPTAGAPLAYNVSCDYGLFYTVSGTAGDYTITYLDQPGDVV